MKKHLLAFVALLCLSLSLNAATVKIDFTTNPIQITESNGQSSTVTKIDQQPLEDVTLNDNLTLSSTGKWWKKRLRLYGSAKDGNNLEIKGAVGVKISKISFAFSNNAMKGTYKVMEGNATSYPTTTSPYESGNATSGTYNWEAPNNREIHAISFTQSGAQTRISSITITYEAGPITVATPTISNEKGKVTLDCSTTGATIMYHVGNAVVTDAAACTDKYNNAPFSVTKGQWVSAYAKKDGATASKVVSKQITWESLPVGDVVSTPAADGDVITVERGSIITFSATNADALAFIDNDKETEIVSNPYYFTVKEETLVMVTPIQDGEEVKGKDAMFTIKIKAAELCGEVVFTPATGAEIATGSTITATAENAVKYAYAFGDATPTVVNNSTLTVTAPSEAGDYTLTVTPYNVDGVAGTTATAEYTVSAPAIASFDIFFNCKQSKGLQISGANAASLEYMVHTDSYAKVTSVSDPSNLCGGPENNGKSGIRFGTYVKGSYNKGSLTINLAHAYKIISIDVILTTYKSTKSEAPKNPTWNLDINGHTMATALTSDVTTPNTYTIPFESTLSRAADGLEDALTIKSTDAPVDVYSLKINFDPVVSGIEKVTFTNEDADAPVEYYNMQGVRVMNPAQGLYIRRQGNRVEKVALR